jgi:HEAT repeat protein
MAVDDLLVKLGAFVSSKDSRLACAAAVVLTELAPRSPAIVKELTAGLHHTDVVRRPFIIEALGRIGTADAAAALVPLIKAEGPAAEQALRVIALAPAAALKPLLQLLGSVPPALLERISECAARTGEPLAFSSLIAHLANADVDICRAVRAGLRSAMSGFDAKAKENLGRQLDKAFNDKKMIQHPPTLIALMKIAGDLGEVSLQRHILDRIDKDEPVNVRRSALQSIAALHLSSVQRAKLAPRLLPLVMDADVANIAEPALEALRQAALGAECQSQIKKLLGSQSHSIREYAMQALANLGSSRTMSDLIACLESPDRSMRDEALSALSHAPAAAVPLCDRLLEMDGGESALDAARAIAPHVGSVPPRLLAALAEQYVQLAAGNGKKKPEPDAARKAEDKRRAILNLFRASHASQLVDAASSHAERLRQKDEAQKACELLRGVSGLHGWRDEHRLELALAGISCGAKELSRSARASDANLQTLHELLFSGRRTPKDLAQHVLKDKSLSRKAVYYMGFHFVERMQMEREFGRMLLENLAEARNEEGRQAREKLVIEGLATVKGGKAGIMEERAKVLLTASDMVADERAREEQKALKALKAQKSQASKKPAPAPAKPKALKPVKTAKPSKPVKPRAS